MWVLFLYCCTLCLLCQLAFKDLANANLYLCFLMFKVYFLWLPFTNFILWNMWHQVVSAAARRLAMNVLGHCAGKLESCMKQFLISSMSGDKSSLNSQLDYHEVIYDIYQCAPQILGGIIPYITGELLVTFYHQFAKLVCLFYLAILLSKCFCPK